MYSLLREPDEFRIEREENAGSASLRFEKCEGLRIFLEASGCAVTFVTLRWRERTEGPVRVLGDAWERLYGEGEWRGIVPERVMPWYMLVASENAVQGIGVKVRPNAFCHWKLDRSGVTLSIDACAASEGVRLEGRSLFLCEVVTGVYEGIGAFAASKRFCKLMSGGAAILPAEPVYGSNNWYYAYGNSSHAEILRDAAFASETAGDLENRPYMVIDDGWSPNMTCGPFDRGNAKFPDMARLAREMKETGVKPGIWIRTLYDDSPFSRDGHTMPGRDRTLDPTDPAVLDYVAKTVERIRSWGFQLLKHDYSSIDLTGTWGAPSGRSCVSDKVRYRDRSRTTAEVAKKLYETILGSAGDMIVLGCNCFNHLTVGYAHLNRTGDDTSGVHFERTRKMGVNTLAFRLCQDEAFFKVDADCVGLTARIPYEYNREWLRLLANSGTPLFVSAKIDDLTKNMREDLGRAFALSAVQKTGLEPLDWMDSTCPAVWKNGDRTEVFRFDETFGVL